MGNRGSEISICTIILLSVALLFFPVQQGYGFFTLPPELNEDQLIELYKLEESVKAEQVRDENFVLLIQQNPYFDTPPNVIISFEENNEENSLDLRNENFQLIKDEQLAIAEKKYKEILGGKTILNSLDNEPINKKSTLKFEIGDEIGSMKKKSDDFEKYRLLQILIAEDYRDNNWKEHRWNSNPYQNNESIDTVVDKPNNSITNEICETGNKITNEISKTKKSSQTIDEEFGDNNRKPMTWGRPNLNQNNESIDTVVDKPNNSITNEICETVDKITNKISKTKKSSQTIDEENQNVNIKLNDKQSEEFGDNNRKPMTWGRPNLNQNNESIDKVVYKPNNSITNEINETGDKITNEISKTKKSSQTIDEENQNVNINLNGRQSEEFKNLITAQVSLAENIRNEMSEFRILGDYNPYLNENIDENIDVPSGKNNINIIINGWPDPTYVIDGLDFNILDRDAKGFEVIKSIQLEIAQNTLNEILLLSNSDKDDVEIIDSTNEIKKLNNYGRNDQGFEFFKNKQIVMAEKKLMEILGDKNIHNSDY